jgi:hypothetical protein
MPVVDYGRIAEETKGKQDAAGVAAALKVKHAEASEVFFKSIEVALGKEIGKANPELDKHGLLTGHKAGGIAIVPKRFESQIRLCYGRTAFCEVNFDQTHSMIQVEMTGEGDGKGIAVPQVLNFHLSSSDSAAVARKFESEKEIPGEFGPVDIAEIVTEGLIRGYFA